MKLLTLIGLFAASTTVLAETCESSGSAYVHSPGYAGGGFTSGYIITNVSNEPVNVKVQLREPNGIVSNVSADNYKFHFSSVNDPLSASGTTLEPGQQGAIYFLNDRDLGVAKISWNANAEGCINDALFASTVSYYIATGKYGYTVNSVNGGKPF